MNFTQGYSQVLYINREDLFIPYNRLSTASCPYKYGQILRDSVFDHLPVFGLGLACDNNTPERGVISFA
jgi:hypothetical protein